MGLKEILEQVTTSLLKVSASLEVSLNDGLISINTSVNNFVEEVENCVNSVITKCSDIPLTSELESIPPEFTSSSTDVPFCPVIDPCLTFVSLDKDVSKCEEI